MNLKKLHYFSGIVISLFVGLHLFNHFYSLFGAESHIDLMSSLRVIYRNIFVESLLLLAVLVQIISGIKLFFRARKKSTSFLRKMQIWAGLYLAVFLMIHVSAVFVGRTILNLDTNFYFGVAGLNSFPINLFFIPYYTLAVFSFFGHIAAVHSMKMKRSIFGINPVKQAYFILLFGGLIALVLLFGLTNGFNGVSIPEEYKVLTGK